MITLWHNPRCSKSREALALLEDRGAKVTVRKYLVDQPDRAEIETVSRKLGVPPLAMMRTGEALFRELGLADCADNPDALFDAMVARETFVEPAPNVALPAKLDASSL